MSEKENEPVSKGYSRRKRGKGNNTTIQEGNDFVLKRYRLEENQTFSMNLFIQKIKIMRSFSTKMLFRAKTKKKTVINGKMTW